MSTAARPRGGPVDVVPVDADNWRACAALEVAGDQARFVAPVTRYLALCAYDDGPWRPFAVVAEDGVVGFVMTGVDPGDGSFWIGGLVVNAGHQGRGYGRAVVRTLVARARADGRLVVRLSYAPDNQAARGLYESLGFRETGEREDDEVVAELRLD